ncbi:hypothetical protein LSTR_LSTR010407 [Laodelphax striatellus]|uniref:vitamin-K-epoxide reductase (warfarin-sensitive) n=1 Tax=Laodelphax striatellus TaxID=195883 RepID=A0A482WSV7_LAOST|nr:hypothetical protein LSTR_LSTR010407 [Laodelphax striatellus]
MNLVLVNNLLKFFATIGFLLSYYAYNVEVSFEEDSNYVAMCDISEHMSCTKAFSSEYGKGFGLTRLIVGEDSPLNQPNGVLGLIFYSIFGLLNCEHPFTKEEGATGAQPPLKIRQTPVLDYFCCLVYWCHCVVTIVECPWLLKTEKANDNIVESVTWRETGTNVTFFKQTK